MIASEFRVAAIHVSIAVFEERLEENEAFNLFGAGNFGEQCKRVEVICRGKFILFLVDCL